VPFELLKTGHMAVMVKVNGKGPYRVIFDTGAPVNLLNNKLARETGLLDDAPQSSLPLFGAVGEARVKSLEVGGEKVEGMHALVMDHPLVELMGKKLGPIYGIVGFPFFARYRMTLDYQAQTLTFVPNGYKPPNVMKSLEGMMFQLLAGGGQGTKVLAPAGQWGLVPHKPSGDETPGVVVKEVLPGGAAAAAGLKAGDRLLTVDGRWTDSVADLYAAAGHVKPGTTVTVVVQRDGKEMELQVKPLAGL
jgi:membrane-associated protease RseP (regulator of RpoE activity)